jgi:hypothetical protein
MAVLPHARAVVTEPEFAAVGAVLPGAVLVQQTASRRQQETLYVLVGGPPQAEVDPALEAIEAEFLTPQKTVSARLIEGVQSASRRVASENRRRLPAERFQLDLALLLLRGDEAMVTLAGEGRAYVLREGALFVIGLAPAPPLGTADPPAPLFHRARLVPTDIVLLTTGDLLDYADPERIAAWFAGGVRKGARWLAAAVGNQLGVLAFEPVALPAEVRSHGVRSRGGEVAPALPLDEVVANAGGAAAALARGVAPVVRLFLPVGSEGTAEEAGAERPRPGRSGSSAAREKQAAPRPSRARSEQRGHEHPWWSLPAPKEGRVEEPPSLPRWTLREEGLGEGAHWAPRVRREGAGESQRRPGSTGSIGLALRPPLLVLAGLVAVLLVGVGALLPTVFSKDRSEGAYVSALNEAERAYRAALASTDQGFARTRLREADFASQRALAARPDDPAARKLVEAIQAETRKLDRVVPLAGIQQLADLGAAGAREVRTLIVDGGKTAYVLDPSGWGVRKISLEANAPREPQIVAVRGTPSDEGPVGDPLAMAWLYPMDARSRVGVMFLDRDRRLFYRPANKPLVELAVRGAIAWQSIQGIRGYVGNLYILDPKANQVWRYLPNWSGYDTEMKGMLENAQISDARDFSIDGSIYVLTESGKVWKFVDGVGTEFDLRALDKPLAKPVAIVTGATARGVYVADPANQRIVVFDKEGRFQRQFVAESLAGLTAFTVDEALGKVWFVADKKLYVAPLPQAPR